MTPIYYMWERMRKYRKSEWRLDIMKQSTGKVGNKKAGKSSIITEHPTAVIDSLFSWAWSVCLCFFFFFFLQISASPQLKMHNRKEFDLTRIILWYDQDYTLIWPGLWLSKKCQKQDGNKELSQYSQELFNMKSMKGKAREDIVWLKSGYINWCDIFEQRIMDWGSERVR